MLFHFPEKYQQPPVSMRIFTVEKSASENGPSRSHPPTVKPKNSTSYGGWKKIKQEECSLHHVKAVNIAVGGHVGYIKQKGFLSTYVTI